MKEKANELSPADVLGMIKSYSPDSKDYLSIVYINQNKLKNLNAWIPSQISIGTITRRNPNVRKLKDVTYEIMEGVTFGGRGSDEVFIIDKSVISKFRIESNLCKKVLKGRDVKKWKVEWAYRFLFYPYDTKGKEVNIKDYPNGYEYIRAFERELSNRVLDGKRINDWVKNGSHSGGLETLKSLKKRKS